MTMKIFSEIKKGRRKFAMKYFKTKNKNVKLGYEVNGESLDIVELVVNLSGEPDPVDDNYDQALDNWEDKKVELASKEVNNFQIWAEKNSGKLGVYYILAHSFLEQEWGSNSLDEVFDDFEYDNGGRGWVYNLD